MHAFIVTGGSKTDRLGHIGKRCDDEHINPFDCVRLVPTESSIGIDSVRLFRRQLSYAPQHNAYAGGIIEDAHTLTIEAQNALLKILEEPPPHVIIFLETPMTSSLLSTILSRCVVTRVQNPHDAVTLPATGEPDVFEKSTAAQWLAYIDSVSTTREAAIAWTVQAIAAVDRDIKLLSQSADKETDREKIAASRVVQGKRLLETYALLLTNVNVKLALDTIVVRA